MSLLKFEEKDKVVVTINLELGKCKQIKPHPIFPTIPQQMKKIQHSAKKMLNKKVFHQLLTSAATWKTRI